MSISLEVMAVELVLKKWKDNPQLTKRQFGAWSSWQTQNDKPLTTEEVDHYKQFLRKYAPSHYSKLFPKTEQ
jgi:hypothetical protein